MTMTDDKPLVDQLRELQSEGAAELKRLLEAHKEERAKVDPTTLPDDEARTAHAATLATADETFKASFDAKKKEFDDRKEQITREIDVESRLADAAAHASPARVTDPLTYRRDNAHEVSYFADLYATWGKCSQPPRGVNQTDARERMRRHADEMLVEYPKRAASREARALKAIEDGIPARELRKFDGEVFERASRVAGSGSESRVNPSTTLGQGGEFSPPLWLEQELIPYMRAGRVAAGLVRNVPLPEGTDSINLPKITTPTLVAPQTANNQAVVSQDIATTTVNTGVKTIAGQEDVALQLLELSPNGLTDRAITEDLQAAYNLNLEFNVIQGTGPNTGTAGGLLGLYPTTNAWGATAVVNTQASPTAPASWGTLGVMASQIAQARYDNTNIQYLMHPRRGYWFAFALDGASSKPFIEEAGFGPWNTAGLEEQDVAEGLLFSLPSGPGVHISKNVPATDNGSGVLSGTYDPMIAFKADDVWLFEGAPRVRVLEEILSGTLQVRFQTYNYVGMIVRYGGSIAIASGTGQAAPTVNSGSF